METLMQFNNAITYIVIALLIIFFDGIRIVSLTHERWGKYSKFAMPVRQIDKFT